MRTNTRDCRKPGRKALDKKIARHGAAAGRNRFWNWLAGSAVVLGIVAPQTGVCTDAADPLLDLLIKKGYVTQNEANQVRAEADALRTNAAGAYSASFSKWKIGDAVKSVELFGDIKFRFEDREVHTPGGDRLALDRYRYAIRMGIRGDFADDIYYGLRLETASNPRSPWVTFGTSTGGTPYQGPFGKSTAGITLGQVYLGWRPADWVDITVGKMPNPLYTTPMVWDSDICPEGLVEHLKYRVGAADFFGNFAQLIYADANPDYTPPFLETAVPFGQNTAAAFLLAWQGGLTYNVNSNISFKAAATLYNYTGGGSDSQGIGGVFVGEGAGVPVNGADGYPTGANDGFTFNQMGINNLLILELPLQVDFKFGRHHARIFGDFAENLDGAQRAEAAVSAALTNNLSIPLSIPLEKNQDKAYQTGLAFGNGNELGQVYGTAIKRNVWEARIYWQHVEQYALDPNLLDSDFFEGRGNEQGIYAALEYGFTDSLFGTARFGYAARIDKKLGTGGSNQDIPQVNPIQQYQVLQLDLACKF